jgi:serpin B
MSANGTACGWFTVERSSSATTPPDTEPTPAKSGEVLLAKSERERNTSPTVTDPALAELSAGNRAFAFDLYQAIRTEGDNLFYSPYSISIALAMAYAGARTATEGQMADTLHFTLPQEQLHPAFNALDLRLTGPDQEDRETNGESFTLRIANALWAQASYPFLPTFLDLVAENYGTGVRLVDFVNPENREQARLAINQWVMDETEDKIKDLIPQGILTELTRLVLANAIYFKGEWDKPFLNGTRDSPFTLLDGEQVSVPMMSRRAETLYAEGDGYQAVELPYKGDRVRMLVVLPAPGQFEAFERSLNDAQLQAILSALSQDDIKLFMPRFQFEASFNLNDVLAAMGMPDAFDPEKADFSGMDGTRWLYIADVLHKAFVAVDEMGTEAAAATGVIVEIVSQPQVVKIDRPFLFVIRDAETGSLLFIGRVVDPRG